MVDTSGRFRGIGITANAMSDLATVEAPRKKRGPRQGYKSKMIAKTPKRYTRKITDLKLIKELLLQNMDKEEIAQKVGISIEALNRLYKPEIEAAGAWGHKTNVPTARALAQAKTCGAIGLSVSDTRRVLNVSGAEFEASYLESYEDGQASGRFAAAREMFRKATKTSDAMPNVTANIFWLKSRAQWKEADKLEISGPDGGPIQTQTAVVILPDNGRDRMGLMGASIPASEPPALIDQEVTD